MKTWALCACVSAAVLTGRAMGEDPCDASLEAGELYLHAIRAGAFDDDQTTALTGSGIVADTLERPGVFASSAYTGHLFGRLEGEVGVSAENATALAEAMFESEIGPVTFNGAFPGDTSPMRFRIRYMFEADDNTPAGSAFVYTRGYCYYGLRLSDNNHPLVHVDSVATFENGVLDPVRSERFIAADANVGHWSILEFSRDVVDRFYIDFTLGGSVVTTVAVPAGSAASSSGTLRLEFVPNPDGTFFELKDGFTANSACLTLFDNRMAGYTFCWADLDGDDELDIDDINLFVTLYIAHDPSINRDGRGDVGLDDIAAFVDSFVAGCG